MTETQLLNTIGLALGMAGVVVVFRFGPPQPSFEEGVGLGLEDNTPLADGRTVKQHSADVSRQRTIHTRMSRIGLTLVFLGFAFQLWATWA